MKKIKMLTVLLMAVFMLTACGSSSGGSSGGNGSSKTYTKTGTSYSDDAGNTYYGNWTDRTTITGSNDRTQVRVFQEEKLEGDYPEMVFETIYTFSKPIQNVYFDGDSYTMLIVANGDAVITAKVSQVRKVNWTEDSAIRANICVLDLENNDDGNFYSNYTMKTGKRYGVFVEHYEPEFAPVTTIVDVR